MAINNIKNPNQNKSKEKERGKDEGREKINKDININPEWKLILQDYFDNQDWTKLTNFIRAEYLDKTKKNISISKRCF